MFVVLEFCSISYSATLQPLGRKERRARLYVQRITLLIFGTIRGTTVIVLQAKYLQHFSFSVEQDSPCLKTRMAHRNRMRDTSRVEGGSAPLPPLGNTILPPKAICTYSTRSMLVLWTNWSHSGILDNDDFSTRAIMFRLKCFYFARCWSGCSLTIFQ